MSSTPTVDPTTLLRTEALTKRFPVAGGVLNTLRGRRRWLTAVDRVDLEIQRGEIFAVVGESGSGKSTLGRLLLNLLTPTEGKVVYGGDDVAAMDAGAMMHYRRRAQVVFQDPYSSLDPRMRVGLQVREPLDVHDIGPKNARDERVVELLERVGLRPEHAQAYPAELSGGQRQRVGIAAALALSPDIIVADEPTSALDVSVQAQVLNLLADLQRDQDLTLVFITHDLGIVRHFCDRVAVMYLGKIVEVADTAALFADPRHPYTRMLFSAIPEPDPTRRTDWQWPEGDPPSPLDPPTGCTFHPRCIHAMARCKREPPALTRGPDGRRVSCFLYDGPSSPPAP